MRKEAFKGQNTHARDSRGVNVTVADNDACNTYQVHKGPSPVLNQLAVKNKPKKDWRFGGAPVRRKENKRIAKRFLEERH